MKKARIILGGITIIAIIGGLLAFKAQKFGTVVLVGNSCYTLNQTCTPFATIFNGTITSNPAVATIAFYSATLAGASCTSDADCTTSTVYVMTGF